MINRIPVNTKLFILSIIKRIRLQGYPSICELFFTLIFLKPVKDKFVAANYRLIVLTFCICKIMEKMVNARLVWYLEKKSILSPIQCGFRKMCLTNDVLVQLESSICEALASKHHYEKAYTAWRYDKLKTIHNLGLRELPLLIHSFILQRFFQVRVGETLSERKYQEEEVPHDSVPSLNPICIIH
ncbi:uncharacterized protein [Palaemon carinicauda]|uniref:uncharacterized protein n=1 Tax=Palaemon carinicauda TaxID=392227 RepID=UPI0035B59A07